jgi:DNA-binding response OmpR family regulator
MTSAKKTILIVEDDMTLNELLVGKFTKEGFDVIVAHDGIEGLAVANERKPDIILLDIIMPKKDGVTMFDELRTGDWGKTAKVVFFTNLGDSSTVSKYATDGDPHSDYLIKSDYRMDDLVTFIRQKLAQD